MNNVPDISRDDVEDSMAGMNAITRGHEAMREKNAVKVGILMACLIEKLEDIGEGGVFVGKYFPEEKMWEDLAGIAENQVAEIQRIAERYYTIILSKITSEA